MSDGTACSRSLADFFVDGFCTGVVLTALVFMRGRGAGMAIAAASGGSSSGAAWKCASAIEASLSAFAARPCFR